MYDSASLVPKIILKTVSSRPPPRSPQLTWDRIVGRKEVQDRLFALRSALSRKSARTDLVRRHE